MDAVFLKLMALYCRQWFLPEERGSILILFLADLSASRGSVHLSLVFLRWLASPREQWKDPPATSKDCNTCAERARLSPSSARPLKSSQVTTTTAWITCAARLATWLPCPAVLNPHLDHAVSKGFRWHRGPPLLRKVIQQPKLKKAPR